MDDMIPPMGSFVIDTAVDHKPNALANTHILWIPLWVSGVICHEKRGKLSSLIYSYTQYPAR
jgi:hypothetical protein